ncbi:MAG: PAS domain S-box protein [Betaproteobacteria bacterium]|nr:PAS domain S-box protein [Betaproteobacteria bacterium]
MEESKLRALRVAAGFLVVGSVIYLSLLLGFFPEQWLRGLGPLLVLLTAGTTLLLVRLGEPIAAARLLVYCGFLALALSSYFSGGLRAAQLAAIPLVILLAGWLLSVRHAVIVTVLSVLLVFALALGAQAGLLPLQANPPLLLAAVPTAVITAVVCVLTAYIVRVHDRELAEISELHSDLAQRVGELQAEKAHLHLIAENVPALIFHGDREQRCLYANRRFADFFHGGGVQVSGMHLREILGESVYLAAEHNIDKVLRGEQVLLEGERTSAAGKDRFLEISLVPERDASGSVVGFFALKRDITERREFERALAESESRFRMLFEQVPTVAVQGYEPDGKVIYWNKASETVYGYRRDEAIGRNLLDLIIPPAMRQEVREAIERMRESGEGLPARELELMRKDGSLVAVFSSHVVLRASSGRQELYCLDVELTDRKEAEHALRRNEERLRLATESGGVGIWDWNIASGHLEWNAQLKRIFGMSLEREELTLDQFVAAIHPDDQQRVQAAYQAALAKGSEFHCEYRIRWPDGSTHWVLAIGHGRYDVGGSPVSMIGAGIDVTERRRAEEKFAKIFFANPVAISLSRLDDGRYGEVNDAYVKLFGWSREELLGHSSIDLGIWKSTEERARWTTRMRKDGGGTRAIEAVLYTRVGEARDVLISAELLDLDGEPTVIAMVHDVTERQRAEDEIRRLNSDLERRVRERTTELTAANRELESFAYSISHDLRAPLRSIDGFSHLLNTEYDARLDEKGRGYLDRVRRAAQRMGSLIDDLLELSRVTRQEMHRVPVDLSQLAAELIEERTRAEPQHRVAVQIAPACVAVGDPQLLRVMLQNLLENAWKYSAKARAPVIEFGTEEQAGERVYFVRDNRVGFDMTYADRLFTPFQRLHRPEEFEGTGVGLASVSRVVRRHGGRIWADAAPGCGATFRFTLGETRT